MQFIRRIYEGDPLPETCRVDRILQTEEVPYYGTGTATRRCHTLLLTDLRYWLTDEQKLEQPLRQARRTPTGDGVPE